MSVISERKAFFDGFLKMFSIQAGRCVPQESKIIIFAPKEIRICVLWFKGCRVLRWLLKGA